MQRKNFKRMGNHLAFNTPQADPIFLILQELEQGYMYIMETAPFGQVQFVHKYLVVDEEPEELAGGWSGDQGLEQPADEAVSKVSKKKQA